MLLGSTCADAWSCWAVGDASTSTLNQVGPPVQLKGNAPQPVAPGIPNNQSQPEAVAEHWNGSSWSVVPVAEPTGTADSLLYDATCATPSDCWAVGGEDAANSNPGPAAPTAVATPPMAAARAMAKAPTAVQPPAAQGSASAIAEHWNGSSWTLVNLPPTTGYLYSVACPSSDDCWAVGSTLDTGDDPLQSYVLHWNGSAWANATIPSSGQNYDMLDSVTCTSVANCWAVGVAGPNSINTNNFPNVSPNVQGADTWFLHWDGTSWSGSPTSDPSSPNGAYLSGVTCVDASECWAVGSTMDQNGNPQDSLVEQWDGSSWTVSPAVSPGAGAELSNVSCVSVTDCWAAGTYGLAQNLKTVVAVKSTTPTAFIERWTGGSWSVDSTPYVASDSFLYGVACVHGAWCFASGATSTSGKRSNGMEPLVEETQEPAGNGQGLYATGTDGGVFNLGDTGFDGSLAGTHLNAPIAGIASTPNGNGYWLVATDGGVFAFGDAAFYGSMGGHHLNAPIVGIAPTFDGKGYWLVAADGGVFDFGDAGFYGSMGGTHLAAPILGLAPTPDSKGYWEVASDGGVFAFGDADYFGSMGGAHLNAPMLGISSTPDGLGYWEFAADGGVFGFGDADFKGSAVGDHQSSPVDAFSPTPDGEGYWMMTSAGAVYNYGDASWLGTLNDIGLKAPITGLSGPA
jgi:hypothetical protein